FALSVAYGCALRGRERSIQLGKFERQGTGAAVADRAAVDAGDGGELAHGAGAEGLVGAVELGEGEVGFDGGDGVAGAEIEDGGAGDAFGAGDGAGGEEAT